MKRTCLKVILAVFLTFTFVSPVFADTTCQTKYPLILAHGMGFEPSAAITNSFGNIIPVLQSKGATVYYTTVVGFGTTEEKALQFKEQFLQIKALSGAEKFNIIGHSHGAIYSRQAISNLGLAPYVASHTSVAGPHRGTPVADLGGSIMSLFPQLFRILLGIVGDDGDALRINTVQLSRKYMNKVFNPNCPDVPGIYYQSWTGRFRTYAILSSLGGFENLLKEYAKGKNGDNAMQFAYLLKSFLPHTAAVIFFMGGGENDGLVPVSSAKWGNFLGTQAGPWYTSGISHIAEVDVDPVSGWSAPNYWVKVVAGLQEKGL